MHPHPYNQSQFICQSFNESTGVGIFCPVACLLLETVYIEKTLEEGKEKGKELSIALLSPNPPKMPRKGVRKTRGKGDLATILKHDLFLL